jgi:hypothetical protein
MDTNIPEIMAEVTDAFQAYEAALTTNGLVTLTQIN